MRLSRLVPSLKEQNTVFAAFPLIARTGGTLSIKLRDVSIVGHYRTASMCQSRPCDADASFDGGVNHRQLTVYSGLW
jgi:hypothetical protein